MIANGAPSFGCRHSTVVVVELNGPNHACAAGSFRAACARPPDRNHLAQVALGVHDDEIAHPGTNVLEAVVRFGLSTARTARQSFFAVDV